MTSPPQRPQRRSCLPLPPLRESLPSPLPTPSSSPTQHGPNSLQLNLAVSGSDTIRGDTSLPKDWSSCGILALPEDPYQDSTAMDVFYWPETDPTDGAKGPSRPDGSPGAQSGHGGSTEPFRFYNLLSKLGAAFFEPRLSCVEKPLDGLTITYCGDQTTYRDMKTLSRLTIYHISDLPDDRIQDLALVAAQVGTSDLPC